MESMYLSHPMPCTMHRPTVARRVHSMIFWRPVGPSCCNCLSVGTTCPRSWKMIDAEMYGMTPSPKIVECPNAPPENTVTNWAARPAAVPSLTCCSKNFASCSWLTPGTGIQYPMRYTASIASVKRILVRSSAIRNTLMKACSMPLVRLSVRSTPKRSYVRADDRADVCVTSCPRTCPRASPQRPSRPWVRRPSCPWRAWRRRPARPRRRSAPSWRPNRA